MKNDNTYIEDIENVVNLNLPWQKLKNSNIVVTGGTGMIGSFFIDVIMYMNKVKKLNCAVYVLGRSKSKAQRRFANYLNSNLFHFILHDINDDLSLNVNADFVLHLASNTHPLQYANDPIGTITTNIIGTNNLLKYASKCENARFVFASSNEIYGQNRGDQELFDENYMGYINPNTLRAGYPESKRAGEALCQAYKKSRNIDVVIPRFTRTYGPTMLKTDSKAISQFIKNALDKENIVLKSRGFQNYSYTYVADAVSGLFTVMLKGHNGEAYNIADKSSNITLKDLAGMLAEISQTKVIYELPDEKESVGYSRATKALLNGEKLRSLGWKPSYDLNQGLSRTILILNRMEKNNGKSSNNFDCCI